MTAMERVGQQIEKVEEQIEEVEKQIQRTQQQIETYEAQMDDCREPTERAALDKKVDRLSKEKEQLRKEKEQLRKKEEQLRDERKLVLAQQQSLSTVPAVHLAGLAPSSSAALSDPAIVALSQQVQQLQLQQQEEQRQRLQMQLQQQEEQRQMLQMQSRIHRLEHTVTTAGDVGARVLQSAEIDPAASFLPPLTTPLLSKILDDLPQGVYRELHSRSVSSFSPSPSPSNAAQLSDDTKLQEHGLDTVNDLTCNRKNPEQPIQASYTALLPHLLSRLRSSLHFHDTHMRNYLTLPTGKIDVTFTASGAVVWSDVVTLAEFKPSLVRSTPAYNEAVGQVIQRCQDIFDQQPQRSFVVAMVMDAVNIDVLHVSNSAPFRLVHTGRLPFALSVESVGFVALCRVLSAPMDRLGFVAAAVPAPFELKSPRGTVSDFVPLRAHSLSLRTSAVYRASCSRWKNQQLVVKFSPPNDDAAHEATILSDLHAVASEAKPCPSSIPRVLAYGPLPKPHDHFHHFLLMEPFGRHLGMGSDEPIEVICRVLSGVCDAMEYAFLKLNLLHRDISYGNIIMIDRPKLQGVLIDWHVASERQQEAHCDRITGTPLFTAHRLFFPNHAHSLLDDLESLLYVLLHVATNGCLPWSRSSHKEMDAMKYWHLTQEAPFEDLLRMCVVSLRPLIRQLRALIFFFEASAVEPAHSLSQQPSKPSSTPPSDPNAQLAGALSHHAILVRFREALRSYSSRS